WKRLKIPIGRTKSPHSSITAFSRNAGVRHIVFSNRQDFCHLRFTMTKMVPGFLYLRAFSTQDFTLRQHYLFALMRPRAKEVRRELLVPKRWNTIPSTSVGSG